MRSSLSAELGKGSNRVPRARRMGELLSIIFLALLGTVATMIDAPGSHAKAPGTELTSTTTR